MCACPVSKNSRHSLDYFPFLCIGYYSRRWIQEKQLSDNMLQDIKYSMRRARQVQWRYNGMLFTLHYTLHQCLLSLRVVDNNSRKYWSLVNLPYKCTKRRYHEKCCGFVEKIYSLLLPEPAMFPLWQLDIFHILLTISRHFYIQI